MGALANGNETAVPPEQIQSFPPPITLRPFHQSNSDVSALMALFTDEATRFVCFHPFVDRDDAVRFVQSYILPHPWYRVICLADCGRPVGAIKLRPEDAGDGRRRVSVGYNIDPKFWGVGIATAAVKMAVAAAFEKWPDAERVQGLVYLENVASQRVLEKAGFEREGVLRKYLISKGQVKDVVMFSFISTDRRLC